MVKKFIRVEETLPHIPHVTIAREEQTPGNLSQELWIASPSAHVQGEMDAIFQFGDATREYKIKFYLQLAVAMGNVYKLIMGEDYPEYQFGILIDSNQLIPARFSSYLPNSKPYDVCLMEEPEEQKQLLEADYEAYRSQRCVYLNGNMLVPGTNKLVVQNVEKKLIGLMALFALCLFFDDGDFKPDNIVIKEKEKFYQAIKIDPEIACSAGFFTQTDLDIKLILKNVFKSPFFLDFIQAHIGEDYGDSKQFESILKGLFQNAERLDEFYVTLNQILKLTSTQFRSMLETYIDPVYHEQVLLLENAFSKRNYLFQTILQNQANNAATENKTVLFLPSDKFHKRALSEKKQEKEEEKDEEGNRGLNKKYKSDEDSDEEVVTNFKKSRKSSS